MYLLNGPFLHEISVIIIMVFGKKWAQKVVISMENNKKTKLKKVRQNIGKKILKKYLLIVPEIEINL